MTNNATALIVVADGTEEMEFSASVDILGLAGFEIFIASVMPENRRECKLGRGLVVTADHHIDSVEICEKNFTVIVVPGGIPGASNCAASDALIAKLKAQKECGGWYAAICAAPSVVFLDKGIVKEEKIVCFEYPGFTMFSDPVRASGNLADLSNRVVVDGKCITSVGPGSAMEFALAIVECVLGRQKAEYIAQGMLIEYTTRPKFIDGGA